MTFNGAVTEQIALAEPGTQTASRAIKFRLT